MAIWFTSDTHLYHLNVIKYSGRPFRTSAGEPDVHLMNEEIIRRWNNVVKPDDTIIHVGDVAFCNISKLKPMFDRLSGKKILVRGNHDRGWTDTKWKQLGFAEVHKQLELCSDGLRALVTHIPQRDIGLLTTNVHGHVHELWKKHGKHINVGVDQWDYTPVSIPQVLEALKAEDDNGYTVPDSTPEDRSIL